MRSKHHFKRATISYTHKPAKSPYESLQGYVSPTAVRCAEETKLRGRSCRR